jgi:GH25 family lysozyme M1 (1,4-beta-N-acetylmuramidase)
MTLFYPDVSNNNWSNVQDLYNFLNQLREQGFVGVAHKVTQGSDFVDEYWLPCLEWCIQNGFPVIGYHYVDTSDPAAQANNWLNAKGTPNAMLDWEEGSGTLDTFWAVSNALNNVGTNIQLSYDPKWYLNGDGGGGDLSILAANGIQLVSSAYADGYTQGNAVDIYNACGGDGGEGWAPYNGGVPAVWQFTSSATVSGFSNVDVNAYKGNDIRELFGG